MKMNSTLDYLAEKHSTLINGYRTLDGKNSESCGLIALEISQRLLEEGKYPHLKSVSDKEYLVPLMFKGNVKWGLHVFCCEHDIVYDPILDKPTHINNYLKLVFGKRLSVRVSANELETILMVNRMQKYSLTSKPTSL